LERTFSLENKLDLRAGLAPSHEFLTQVAMLKEELAMVKGVKAQEIS